MIGSPARGRCQLEACDGKELGPRFLSYLTLRSPPTPGNLAARIPILMNREIVGDFCSQASPVPGISYAASGRASAVSKLSLAFDVRGPLRGCHPGVLRLRLPAGRSYFAPIKSLAKFLLTPGADCHSGKQQATRLMVEAPSTALGSRTIQSGFIGRMYMIRRGLA